MNSHVWKPGDSGIGVGSTTSSQRKPRIRLQVSLSTILLVTAVTAVWIAYANALKETAKLQARLPGLRLIAGELRIEDPHQFTVIQRLPTKYDELIWDVHVPDPRLGNPDLPDAKAEPGTQLCVALDKIPKQLDWSVPLEPLEAVMLMPGRHTIELTYERGEGTSELIVLIDGEPQLKITRPKDWEPGKGWSSTNSRSFTTSESDALDEPLVLLNRRFMRDIGGGSSSTPDEPSEGILIWVQRGESSDQ